MNGHALGRAGEKAARHYLKGRGFRILCTNFRCTYGELDIIARDACSLVFVEVKCRSRPDGFEQAVGAKKILSLSRSAEAFLQRAGWEEADYRFMLLFVSPPGPGSKRARIRCVEDPF